MRRLFGPGLLNVRHTNSVRNRLALAYSLLIGAIALFISFYFPARFEKQAIDGLQTTSKSIAEITAYSVSAPLLFRDERGIRDVLLAARADEALYSIIVRDEKTVVVGSMRGAIQWVPGSDKRSASQKLVVSSADVMSQGRKIGTVAVALSLAEVEAEVATTRMHISLVSMIIFIVGLALVLGIANLVLAPLAAIVRATKRIAGGDLASRAPVGYTDEFGALATAFNSMVDRLEGAHSDLTTVNQTLELRVAQRTEQLRHESDERLNAQLEQQRSEKRFRIMFESSPLGGVLFDEHGTVLESNAAMREMVGGPPENALTSEILAAHLHAKDRRNSWRQFKTLMGGRKDSVSAEVRFIHATGATIFTHVTLSAVRDTSSQAKLGIMMVENVTGERMLGEQLRQSQKLEAIGQLAGGIAHDFNNLLTTINGSAELLLEEHEGTSMTDDLRDIIDAGKRAAGLTAQLLAFSRRQVMQPKVLDVNAVVTDLSKMLRRLITANIRLELDLGPNLGSVKADPGQIEQVIMNLTINARDAMPAGGRIVIKTDVMDLTKAQAYEFGAAQAGAHVSICVMDSGTGIPADALEHIFEPFYTTKDVGKGTGLGLATVYGIIKQSGGGITVNSVVGKGTTFCVVLPAIAGESVVDAPAPPPPPVIGSETILLVEDEEGVRSVLRRALHRSGYTVLESRNGREAVEMFKREMHFIAAVITDVVMPEMGGPEFVRAATTLRPGLKVIYMSGYARDENIQQGLERPSTLFIQKPVQLSTLLSTLRNLLDSNPVGGAHTDTRSPAGVNLRLDRTREPAV